jgi:hypothetical protein
MHFQPKRGKTENIHKAKFIEHELIYLTDLKMLGVTDENMKPQLLVEVLEFNRKEDFPKDGQPNKLYKTNEGETFFFNGQSYHAIKVNFSYHGDKYSPVVKLGD